MATLPSLAMIPSGYKANKIYSKLPTNGSGDLDFARTSTATRINSEGLIEEVLTGVPRLDYADGVCPSLLLEPASTNRVINSAEGVYGNAPASSTNIISPDGTNNAYIPVVDSVNNRYEQIIPAGTYATGQKLTYSWYRKRISSPTGTVRVGDLDIRSLVNLTELEVNNARQIQSDINGFDRFEAVVQVIDGSLSSTFKAYFGAVVGIGNSSVAYWGHQFEPLEYSTSLIITTGTIQTRTADSASKSGISSLINSSEGVLYVETKGFSNERIGNGYISLRRDGDSAFINSLMIQHRSNGTLRIYVNGSGTANIHFNENIDFTKNHKIAILYKLNGYKLFIDGVSKSLFGTPVQTVFSGLDNLSFGLVSNSQNWQGSIKDARVFKTALTTLEIETLTSYSSFNEMALNFNYKIQ